LPEFAKTIEKTSEKMTDIEIANKLNEIEEKSIKNIEEKKSDTTPLQKEILKSDKEKEEIVDNVSEKNINSDDGVGEKKEVPYRRIPYSELRNKKNISETKNTNSLDSIGIFKNKKTVFYLFISPPIIVSLISFFHLITFYETGNPQWIALAMAFAIEIASIASLLALVFLNKIKKFTIVLLFGVLLITQLFGNCFFSYIYLKNSALLVELLEFFGMENTIGSLRLLSFIVSGIPVLVSLSFIKSAINMFRDE
jgi:hypothetical protein